MVYSDDGLLSRLASLNDSQESISLASHWVMFYKRHAERIVQLWLQHLKESNSNKRLNLIYLANDVVQTSKMRQRDELPAAFSPHIAEASALAYKGASPDVRNKLKRVVDVWKERGTFEAAVQASIEERIEEIDKRAGGGLRHSGSSLFAGPRLPSELAGLFTSYQKTTKLAAPTKSAVENASHEYDKLTDPASPIPPAPVHAARLNGLLKTLAAAEAAVAESVKARGEHVSALEALLTSARAKLDDDEKHLAQLSERKTDTENKKQEIELSIMRGLDPVEGHGDSPDRSPKRGGDSPEVEAFTPPPLTEEGAPTVESGALTPNEDAAAPDFPQVVPDWPNKRRRVDLDGDFDDLGADAGIHPEMASMLNLRPAR